MNFYLKKVRFLKKIYKSIARFDIENKKNKKSP